MTSTVTRSAEAWLPANALAPSRFEARLGRLLQDWSEQWFTQDRLTCHHQLVDTSTKLSEVWRPIGADAMLSTVAEGLKALGLAALGRRRHGGNLSEQDRKVIADVAQQAMSALSDALTDLSAGMSVAAPPERPALNWVHWQLRWQDGQAFGRMALSPALLVHMRKQQLPASASVALEPLEEAIACQPVRCEVALGSCSVSLSEAETLAIGDVLVLDRMTDDLIDLRAGSATTPMTGRLQQGGDQAIITIEGKDRVS